MSGTDHTHDEAPSRERSASLTLDQIRDGGQALVMLCQTRLTDCAEAISEGRFLDALNHVQEAAQKVQALAMAENALASLAEVFIIRAEQVEAGMVIRGHGTVSEVRREPRPIPGDDPCQHVIISFDGDSEALDIHAEHEVVIARGD